jgi:hypothetical protein
VYKKTAKCQPDQRSTTDNSSHSRNHAKQKDAYPNNKKTLRGYQPSQKPSANNPYHFKTQISHTPISSDLPPNLAI